LVHDANGFSDGYERGVPAEERTALWRGLIDPPDREYAKGRRKGNWMRDAAVKSPLVEQLLQSPDFTWIRGIRRVKATD